MRVDVTVGASTLNAVIDFNVDDLSYTKGSGDTTIDLAQFYAGSIPIGQEFLSLTSVGAALPSGWAFDSANQRIDITDASTTPETATGLQFSVETQAVASSAEADWQSRIAGTDVVWYHGFETQSEVDRFKYSSGTLGNDPGSLATDSELLRRIDTDGPRGHCMEYAHPSGASPNNTYMWRPLAPFSSGHGRATADPAANDTITKEVWAPPQSSEYIRLTWPDSHYYRHPNYGASDGTEFYFQCRFKADPNRIGSSQNRSNPNGKLFWFTSTENSLEDGEHVFVSYGPQGNDGTKNYVNVYVLGVNNNSGGPFGYLFQGQDNVPFTNAPQPGSDVSTTWSWSGGWDTILINIRPGVEDVASGVNSTRLRVWVANEGETSYTKITEVTYPVGTWNSHGGLNAVILGGFQNNNDFNPAFYHRYADVIFSKSFIPCPQAY